MRIVLSGGTGFVGMALTRSLAARGDDVVILTRGGAPQVPGVAGGGAIELVPWTPDRAGDWMKVVDGADAIVNLAGASVADQRWTPERKAILRASRIDSTKLLVQAIERASKRPRTLVSISGVGHYGMKAGSRVLHEGEPAGDDFLARLTTDWEAAATEAKTLGVRVAILRLGLVLGRDSGVYGKLAPLFKAYVGGPVGDGEQYMPWIHIRDVVRAIELLIDREDLDGNFNVVAPEPVTMNVFSSELGASLQRPAVMRVPAFAVKVAMGSEAAEAVLTGQRAIPKRLTDAGFAFVFPDLRSALADLAMLGS